MRVHNEHKLQCSFIEWTKYNLGRFPELELLYAIPNGEKRTKLAGARLKREGVKRGIPDLHLPVGRKGFNSLYIETKTSKGRISVDQKKVIEKLEKENNACVICRTLEEFIDVIERYLLTKNGKDPMIK